MLVLRAVALLLVAAALPACATTRPGWAGDWVADRGADAMDLVGLRVSLGPGLGVYARATGWVQLGILKRGRGDQDLPAPKGGTLRAVPCVSVGTIGRYGGIWFESCGEAFLPGWAGRSERFAIEDGPAVDREPIVGYVSPHGERDLWEQSFGAGVHLLLAGAEVELRPWQLADFLAGLVGYDPSGDDLSPEVGVPEPSTFDDEADSLPSS